MGVPPSYHPFVNGIFHHQQPFCGDPMPGKYGIHLVQHYEMGLSRNKATFMVAGCFKSWKSRVKWMMNMMIWGYSHGHGNLQKYLAQLTEPLVKTPPVLADLPDLLQAPDHSLLEETLTQFAAGSEKKIYGSLQSMGVPPVIIHL